jgi:hypothetical protein
MGTNGHESQNDPDNAIKVEEEDDLKLAIRKGLTQRTQRAQRAVENCGRPPNPLASGLHNEHAGGPVRAALAALQSKGNQGKSNQIKPLFIFNFKPS